MRKKKYIFLSYSRKDYDFAMRLKEDLEKSGFDVWVDQSKIVGGDAWRKSINDALKNSHTVVWVVSPDSVNSKYVNKELSFADGKDVRIIPVMYKKAEIPFPYHELQFVDVSDGYNQNSLDEIIKIIGITNIYSDLFSFNLNNIKPKMVRILNSLSIDMIHIKKGSFMMGEEEKPKKVTIEHDFYMGKNPVIIAEYMHFVKDVKEHYPAWLEEGSEYNIKTGNNDRYKKMNLTDNAPIIGVSWHDATAYCKWLSEKTKENYRLPTEKEWEYACRAGTTTEWSFGDDEKELKKYAWYDENSYDLGEDHPDYGTHEVGQKKPNPWGLYDMHGNVWEWCEDWYDEEKKYKVLRGGSWYNNADSTRSAFRNWVSPSIRINDWGFRLLRTLPSDFGDS